MVLPGFTGQLSYVLVSASERKGEIQTATFLNIDRLLAANCGRNPTGLNYVFGVCYIQSNECQASK